METARSAGNRISGKFIRMLECHGSVLYKLFHGLWSRRRYTFSNPIYDWIRKTGKFRFFLSVIRYVGIYSAELSNNFNNCLI